MSRIPATVACTLLLVAAGTLAQPVPYQLQAALFAKLFKYDQRFEGRSDAVQVVVVHGANVEDATAMAQVLTGAGLSARLATLEDLASATSRMDVAYAMPDVSAAQVGRLCAKAGGLSTSGNASDADAGLVSVALGLKADGRPLIVVNMAQAAREGHTFSAQLLALARVVR